MQCYDFLGLVTAASYLKLSVVLTLFFFKSVHLCASSASAGDPFPLYFCSIGQKAGEELLADPTESFVCKDSGLVFLRSRFF